MQNCSAKVKSSYNLNERSYRLALKVIDLTNNLPNKRSSWVIADQLIRSATSIGANQIEARASSSRLEFKKFFEISLKSANESKYWLCLLRDTKLADREVIDNILTEVNELSNMLGKSVLTLKSKKL